jgi:hypothetical protein
MCGGSGSGSATISAARGPAAANANGWSLRATPGIRQKVSATTPRSADAGVAAGSNGVASSPVHAGITSVPPGPRAPRRASMSPRGPPSTGRTARKEVCTSSTPPRSTPSARSWPATSSLPISFLSMWLSIVCIRVREARTVESVSCGTRFSIKRASARSSSRDFRAAEM